MPEICTTETWKPVVGFEWTYQVSSHGRVRSITRRGAPAWRTHHGKVLRPGPSSKRVYLQVNLSQNGINSVRLVHLLVLEAFVGPAPAGMECRHLDGNGRNNALENLAWGTRTENAADRITHGTVLRGESNPGSRLTDEAVLAIRREVAAGLSYSVVAGRHGVSPTTVGRVARRDLWSHVHPGSPGASPGAIPGSSASDVARQSAPAEGQGALE